MLFFCRLHDVDDIDEVDAMLFRLPYDPKSIAGVLVSMTSLFEEAAFPSRPLRTMQSIPLLVNVVICTYLTLDQMSHYAEIGSCGILHVTKIASFKGTQR